MQQVDASLSSSLQKAMGHLSQGNGERVIASCKKLLKRYPRNFDVLHLCGIGYQLTGRFDRALDSYQKALEVNPGGSAALFCNLAFACLKVDDSDAFQAEKFASKARQMAPTLQEPYEVSSDVSRRVGDPISSKEFLDTALEISPQNPGLWVKRASTLRALGSLDQALESVRQALKIEPGSPEALLELGDLRDIMGETELAIQAFQEAIDQGAKNPEDIEQRILFVLSTHGNTDYFVDRAQQILTNNTDHVPARIRLLQSGNYPGGTQKGVDDLPKSTRQHSILAGFAIAKGFEKERKYDESFRFYQHANKLKYEASPRYSPGKTTKQFELIKRFYSSYGDELLKPTDKLDDYPTPIFVLGMPRSGTSLTEQLLGSHSEIRPAGELQFLLSLSRFGSHEFKATPQQRVPEYWAWVRDVYLECLSFHSDGKPFVVDKMPSNFILSGFIRKLFPNAIIVHTIRDPLSTCFSIYKENFAGNHPYAQDQVALAKYYSQYLDLMSFWRSQPGINMLDFSYEKLVQDMPQQIDLVLQRCDLDWEEQISNFHSSDRIVRTASNDQVRRPIYQTSIKNWKHFEQHLEPLISTLMQMGVIEESDIR